jgi:repressor LexA
MEAQIREIQRSEPLRSTLEPCRATLFEDLGSNSTVPIFGHIPAGFSEPRSQNDEGCIRIDLESVGIPKNSRTFALKVRGDSMIGAGILNGDIVILELRPPHEGAIVAALIDGETTLKRYLVNKGRPYLKAENPKFKNLIPAQELVIQGVYKCLIRLA